MNECKWCGEADVSVGTHACDPADVRAKAWMDVEAWLRGLGWREQMTQMMLTDFRIHVVESKAGA